MGEHLKLHSDDGFEFNAYQAIPDGTAKGAVLVIQEVFGVNAHIRSVVDVYAQVGYAALAPAIFDRAEVGVELNYDAQGVSQGVDLARNQLEKSQTLADLGVAVDCLSEYGKVGVVGYCFGGLLAYLMASSATEIACAVGYYGGGITGVLDHQPKVPLMLHFGELDAHISMQDVAQIKAALPQVAVHTYPADHGFNCDARASYGEEAAKLALQRTLAFYAEHLTS